MHLIPQFHLLELFLHEKKRQFCVHKYSTEIISTFLKLYLHVLPTYLFPVGSVGPFSCMRRNKVRLTESDHLRAQWLHLLARDALLLWIPLSPCSSASTNIRATHSVSGGRDLSAQASKEKRGRDGVMKREEEGRRKCCTQLCCGETWRWTAELGTVFCVFWCGNRRDEFVSDPCFI